MKKITVLNWITVDGFIAGPNGETDWFVWDKEIEKFYEEQQSTVDTIIYGKETYETMSGYWPTEKASGEAPAIVKHMNSTPKIVFSKSLENAGWSNTTVVREIDKAEIENRKQQTGKNIVIYGSGTIVSQFSKLGLIDEYLLMVNPLVLGTGKPLFPNFEQSFKLNLKSTRNFKCGSILSTYEPN